MIKTLLSLVLVVIISVNCLFSMEMENIKQLSSQNSHQGDDLREIEQKDDDSEIATMRALADLEISDIEPTTLNSTAALLFNTIKNDPEAGPRDKYEAYRQARYITELKKVEDSKKSSLFKILDNKYAVWGGMLAGACFFGFTLKNYSTVIAELTKTLSDLPMQNTIETIVKDAVSSLQTTEGSVSTATMFSMQALMPLIAAVGYKPTL